MRTFPNGEGLAVPDTQALLNLKKGRLSISLLLVPVLLCCPLPAGALLKLLLPLLLQLLLVLPQLLLLAPLVLQNLSLLRHHLRRVLPQPPLLLRKRTTC